MEKELRAKPRKKRRAGAPTKKEIRYRNIGRKTLLTKEVILKMEQCANLRATPTEICSFCNISRDTYYRWMKDNPDLSDRLNDLRERPFLKARQTIINGLNEVPTAFKFLEKEKPEDYGDKIKVEHSGEIGNGGFDYEEDELLRQEFRNKLKDNIEKRWKNKNKQDEQQPADKKED